MICDFCKKNKSYSSFIGNQPCCNECLDKYFYARRPEMQNVKLKLHQIKAAETALSKGDRVELIPVRDGVKVMRVRREEVKT